ncbi:MAG: hypothetical protein ACI97B_001960 [Verrucomicrobiales bacterium]|jgi:hypothetical protein
MPAGHRAVFESHCITCHNADKQKGKLRLDDLPFTIADIETAERWQKVLNVLNAGEMPPEDEEPLPNKAKTDLLDDLSNVMVEARKLLGDQHGAITMRRLNRREYGNTLRELLGVKINVTELPSDAGTGGFDTAGQNLFMSSTQIEQYQSLGREALEEAFALLAAAGAEQSFRYEPEESNERFQKEIAEKLDALERAEKWAKAVDEAAARPEHGAAVTKLREQFPAEAAFRREWKQIPGAPAPEAFGFETVENNADKANRALGYRETSGTGYMRPYDEYLLGLPHQDKGAWLSIMGGLNSNLTLFLPWKWNETLPGEYRVRIRLAHAENAPSERCFIEFGIHPRDGQILSTHEVTGTLAEPQIIEIPLSLTSAHKTRENRQLFIREKGAFDHYTQTRRVFDAAKKENGIGPQAAIWVDWMEIERVTNTPKPAPGTFHVHSNRQLSSVSAKGLREVRFECETANDKVEAYIEKLKDDREQARKWVKAVEDAAARPENQAVVAELKRAERRPGEYRRSWEQINGAPSPESFGFKTNENNADKAAGALGDNWQKYFEYYLSRPALDRGAYLGVKTLHPSLLALDHLQFPVPGSWKSGDYVFRVGVAATDDARPEQRFLEAGMHPRNGKVRATFEITGTLDNPQIVEMPFTLTRKQVDAGDRTLWIREKGAWDNNEEGIRKRQEAIKRNGIGPELVVWIDWMEVERLSEATKPLPRGIAALDMPLDDESQAPAIAEVQAALTRFATVAFRGRAPSGGYVQRLMSIYDTHLKSGAAPKAALKDTLSIILASPMFLYFTEPAIDDQARTLTDLELATRLSYFLWSAPPDEILLDLAKQNELGKPPILVEQTTRLLDDPRASEFVNGFLYQWLGMARFDFFEVNRAMYPRFDDSTKLAAKNEVYETFAYMLRHNAPLSDLLKADYIVTNPLLAHFYGIPGVSGDTYQKVGLPAGSPRGGLLGMSAIHFMGGNGEHTSPVERGVWVLRKLLNDPPPPAPANVPQLARLAGKVLTTRERVIAHQEDPQCASCHRKIDPIGFGLENFDPVGQWRTEDSYQVKDENGKPVKGASKTWTIEANAALHSGPSFKDYFELRDLVASNSENFAAGFSAALIEYALGRSIGFADETLISEMVETAKKNNLSTRAFIHALISSKVFKRK